MKKWTKLSRNEKKWSRQNRPEKETKYKEKVDKVVQKWSVQKKKRNTRKKWTKLSRNEKNELSRKRNKMVSRKETKHKEQVDKVVTLFINVKLNNDSSKSKYTRPSFFL